MMRTKWTLSQECKVSSTIKKKVNGTLIIRIKEKKTCHFNRCIKICDKSQRSFTIFKKISANFSSDKGNL